MIKVGQIYNAPCLGGKMNRYIFQTRGLTDVEATVIWQKLSPIRIK